MKIGILINGDRELRAKFANVAECAVAGTLTRRGMTEAARIVTRAQKNMAPVRKRRVQLRKLNKRLAKGMEVGKATRLSSVEDIRTRKPSKHFIGPIDPNNPKRIPPGLVKRSIGFRVLRKDGNFVVKMGMNVGKRRSHQNFAPHASFVGKGTKQRYSNGKLKGGEYGPKRANRGIMPQNRFIADATQMAAGAAIAALDKAVKQDQVRAYRLDLRASRVFA